MSTSQFFLIHLQNSALGRLTRAELRRGTYCTIFGHEFHHHEFQPVNLTLYLLPKKQNKADKNVLNAQENLYFTFLIKIDHFHDVFIENLTGLTSSSIHQNKSLCTEIKKV